MFLVRAPWNDAYLGELCSFPAGSHDDQTDSSARSYSHLIQRREDTGPIVAPIFIT